MSVAGRRVFGAKSPLGEQDTIVENLMRGVNLGSQMFRGINIIEMRLSCTICLYYGCTWVLLVR